MQTLNDADLKLSFELDDSITTSFADDSFDVIFNRGCYHSVCCFSHDAYSNQIKRILRPNGVLLLKTMSMSEDRFGDVEIPMPCIFDTATLREVFSSYFDVVEVKDSYFYSAVTDPPARAKFAIL